MSQTRNMQSRDNLLGSLMALSERYDQLSEEAEIAEEKDELSVEQKERIENLSGTRQEIQDLIALYLEGLPNRQVSRCPFTGEALVMAIDDVNIDGLWWNYNAPKRPVNQFPETYFALDGALKLDGNPPNMKFLCCPGPDIPFVLPRLLEYTQIRAVVSTVKIGLHMAYPIFYYADPMFYEEMRINDWGTDHYWEPGSLIPGILTPGQYISQETDVDEYDFDLAYWIKRGKLLWIAADDEQLNLRSEVKGCPYLELQGSRVPKYIQNGKVWEEDQTVSVWEEDDPAFDADDMLKRIEEIEKEEVDDDR